MKRYLLNCLVSGTLGGIASHVVASLFSRHEHRRSELPMHAVSHIYYDDEPASHEGDEPIDAAIGSVLHHGASIFWAAFFEALFGRDAEKSTSAALAGGATIAAAAYITDYHIVSDRYKPGFEAVLSDRALFLVYAALGAGLAAGARLRGLRNHQVEDGDEREERGKAERGPDAVVAPEERR
ncbi:MAG TPA: hypothetical protein VHP37_21425 [Burkholderiales bacterium]|nr:hypothetical protein [Burkholderiales bacterium]